jgi:tRNA(Ile)-lysidine synthase
VTLVAAGQKITATVERRVCEFVRERDVLREGERALLMLSGGADSMALLALIPLVAARLGLGLRLAALHMDYATRGADSRRDRLIVQRACAAQGTSSG